MAVGECSEAVLAIACEQMHTRVVGLDLIPACLARATEYSRGGDPSRANRWRLRDPRRGRMEGQAEHGRTVGA